MGVHLRMGKLVVVFLILCTSTCWAARVQIKLDRDTFVVSGGNSTLITGGNEILYGSSTGGINSINIIGTNCKCPIRHPCKHPYKPNHCCKRIPGRGCLPRPLC